MIRFIAARNHAGRSRRALADDAVNPFYYGMANQIHNALIQAIMARSPLDLIAIASVDEELSFLDLGISSSASEKLRVLRALAAGFSTSSEIAGVLGIQPKQVSAWLSVLFREGEIKQTGIQNFGKRGRKQLIYALAP
jgi:hypothetical protein